MILKSKQDLCYIFVLIFIFFIAFLYRLVVFLDAKPIWNDEASVALTVMNNGFFEIFGNVVNNAKASVLFFLIVKLTGQIGNYSEISLRFYPFVASILSIFIFYFLSKKYLIKKSSIIISNFLFAINYYLIYFSQELKQYSSDVLWVLISVLVFTKLSEIDFNKRNSFLYFSFVLFLFFISFPACFFAVGFAIYKFFNLKKEEYIYFFSSNLFLLFIALFVCKLFYIDMYNLEVERVYSYWESGFLTFSNSFETFNSLCSYFLYPSKTYLLASVLVFITFFFMFKNKRNIDLIILSGLFFVLLFSVLKIYPLYERVALYLLPFLLLFIVRPFDFVEVKTKSFFVILFLFISTFVCYLNINYYTYFFQKDALTIYDGRSTLLYIKQKYKEGDRLLVNNLSKNTYEYYSKKLNFYPEIEVFDFSQKTEKELYKFLDNLKTHGNYWIYIPFSSSRYFNEQKGVYRWAALNKGRVNDEFIIRRSYILNL